MNIIELIFFSNIIKNGENKPKYQIKSISDSNINAEIEKTIK